MEITRLVFYASGTADKKSILKECTGPDAEAAADFILHSLIFTAKKQAGLVVELVATLENGMSWDATIDLAYTHLTDTVRSLIIRSAQMEQLYGDEPREAREFIEALNGGKRKKSGSRTIRVGPIGVDTNKVALDEMAVTVRAELQRQEEFFLSQHRVDLFKKKLKKVNIFIEAYIDFDNGNLVLHGHDCGPTVEEYFGKSDYEYWRLIPCPEKEKVFTLLKEMTPADRLKRLVTMYKHPDIILVRLVKEHFSKDTAISSFEDWCNQQGIECKSYSI